MRPLLRLLVQYPMGEASSQFQDTAATVAGGNLTPGHLPPYAGAPAVFLRVWE